MNRKEKIMSFIFTFIPGVSQIYMGYPLLGLLLLIVFAIPAVMVVVSVLGRIDSIGEMGFVIGCIVWLVSFTDGIVLRHKLITKRIKQRNGRVEGDNETTNGIIVDSVEQLRDEKQSKRRIIAMLLAVFPGVGHMYLGFLKQGIQTMGIFLGLLYLNYLLGESLFIYFIPIIWFFSLFDVMKKVSEEADYGEDIIFISWIKNKNEDTKSSKNRWGLLVLLIGTVTIINKIAAPIISEVFNNYLIKSYVQTGFFAVILIIGGIMLMSSKEI
jgi:TM2 domain-containing membrane protein YozV